MSALFSQFSRPDRSTAEGNSSRLSGCVDRNTLFVLSIAPLSSFTSILAGFEKET